MNAKQPRERKTELVGARLTGRLKAAYEALSAYEERTVSWLIAKALGEWMAEHHPALLGERGAGAQPERAEVPVGNPAVEMLGLVKIPLHDVHAAAGRGEFIGEENLERYLPLSPWLIAELGATPETIIGLRVTGDSMAPELLDRDVVLINTHLNGSAPLEEDVYVFRLGEDLLIKRLRPLPGGGALAVSTNPLYPPFVIPAEPPVGQFQIVGRLAVRWRGPK